MPFGKGGELCLTIGQLSVVFGRLMNCSRAEDDNFDDNRKGRKGEQGWRRGS